MHLATTVTRDEDGFQALLAAHLWPAKPEIDGVEPFTWALDGGGRHLIDAVIQARPDGLMLEIGSFMAGAPRAWMLANPDLRCICVDPWGQNLVAYVARLEGVEWAVRDYGVDAIRHYAAVLATHGPLPVVRNNLAAFKDRCVLVQKGVPEAFDHLLQHGTKPDMVFLDAMKRREEFEGADKAFPDAIICGDDWSWKDADGSQPVQVYAKELAKRRNATIYAHRATFVISEPRHGLQMNEQYRVPV